MDRAKAKSMTRTVQTIAVLLVAATAAAALVPLTVKAEPTTDTPAPTPTAAKPTEAPKVEIDTVTVTASLNSISGPVKNGPIDTPPTGPVVIAPPPTGVDSWRYLGGILSTSYKRAIVVIDDQQHLFAEGQKYNPDPQHNPTGDIEIVQIDKAFVKVKQGETETTINIAPRQRAALTVLDPAAARAAGAGANPAGSPNYNNPAAATRINNPAASMSGISKSRTRDLERLKSDAKARGDEKGAEMIDAELNGAGKEGKFDKGQK